MAMPAARRAVRELRAAAGLAVLLLPAPGLVLCAVHPQQPHQPQRAVHHDMPAKSIAIWRALLHPDFFTCTWMQS